MELMGKDTFTYLVRLGHIAYIELESCIACVETIDGYHGVYFYKGWKCILAWCYNQYSCNCLYLVYLIYEFSS
jgi:hypothetical protein